MDEVVVESTIGPVASFDIVWADNEAGKSYAALGSFSVMPLAVNISVMLVRIDRGRCAECNLRRVRFQLQANTSTASEAVCAKCAGLR